MKPKAIGGPDLPAFTDSVARSVDRLSVSAQRTAAQQEAALAALRAEVAALRRGLNRSAGESA